MGIEAAPWWSELLTQKDTRNTKDLAVTFGTTPGAILRAFLATGTRKRPVTASAPPAAAPPGAEAQDQAWQVWFSGDERPRVLVAADFASLVRAALLRGEVREIRLLGELV